MLDHFYNKMVFIYKFYQEWLTTNMLEFWLFIILLFTMVYLDSIYDTKF